MSLKLDDLLIKKKEPVQILDLSKCTANSKEELKRLLEKVPEYKIKFEKIKPEDIRIREKKFTFKTRKKELAVQKYPFANPIPNEMRSLRLEDLCGVNIQWKMLTSIRPKTKIDEEYFSRLVDLGKLTLKTRNEEKSDPFTKYIKKVKNRFGFTETRVVICSECRHEFCLKEECQNFTYDSYQRINNLLRTSDELTQQTTASKPDKMKKNKRKKNRKLIKTKRMKHRPVKSLLSKKTDKHIAQAKKEKNICAKNVTKNTPPKGTMISSNTKNNRIQNEKQILKGKTKPNCITKNLSQKISEAKSDKNICAKNNDTKTQPESTVSTKTKNKVIENKKQIPKSETTPNRITKNLSQKTSTTIKNSNINKNVKKNYK